MTVGNEKFIPLSGDWRHTNGYLICGTMRIARMDFDTDPSDEFKQQLFDWIVDTLNKETENQYDKR